MTETTTQPGTVAADWTADPQTCRSNSSALYLRLVSEVARLIRAEAHALIRGNTEAAAGLIMAQLAHVHGLAPSYRVPGQVTVSLDDLRIVACSPEDGPPGEEYPGALRRLRAAVGAGTLDQRPASNPPQPSDSDDPPPAGLDVEPVVITRGDLLSEWRKTHPGACSCPPGRADPSCPQHGEDPDRGAGLYARDAFLAASVAVWREIDRLDADPGGYHPTRMSVDLRLRERAAWERYRDEVLDAGDRDRMAGEPVHPPAGAALIAAERARQVTEEGWTAEHDAEHTAGELAIAAACYAVPAGKRAVRSFAADVSAGRGSWYKDIPDAWPWHPGYWKPSPDDRIRELVKAGALIAAEIDRLRTAAEAEQL